MSRFLTGLFAALALLISGVPAAAQSIGYSPNTLPLSGSCGVVTVSTPCLDLTQTWNNVATTFTGLKLNVTDTASAVGSLLMDLQVGGSSKFSVQKYGDISGYGNLSLFVDTASIKLGGVSDVVVTRDAANALALRNGTAAQAFNIYNTYTDASNYERLSIIAQSGNDVRIQTAKAGTGTARALLLGTDASVRWLIGATSGHFLAGADNTYDIGDNATRIRSGYFGTNVVIGYSTTSTAQLHVGAGNAVTAPNGAGGNVIPQVVNSQTSGVASTGVGVFDGTFNRRASFFVNHTDGVWGLGLGYSSTPLPFVVFNSGAVQFQLSTAGVATLYNNLLFSADNSYDIGASGANRPRNVYVGGALTTGGNVTVEAGASVVFGNRGYMNTSANGAFVFYDATGTNSVTATVGASNLLTLNGPIAVPNAGWVGTVSRGGIVFPDDGVLRLTNNAGTDFTRLILGTNDTSGIAIKKNGTSFSFVLGDDSAFASVAMKDITTSNTTFLHATSASLANGAAAQVATMTNGPTAGNPTKWIAINDNGTTRYIPAW